MSLLTYGDKVGIVACSNGLDEKNKAEMKRLETTLTDLGLEVIFSNKLYKIISVFNGSNEEKAKVLMDFFKDSEIKAIFDVSGGDLANGILDYLHFEIIEKNQKPFFGYSDLSVIVNALYAKTGMKTYLYQIKNLINSNGEVQIKNFKQTFINSKDNVYFDGEGFCNKNPLLNFNYEWIQGSEMNGIVVGGNLRCLLKLSGTEYMPDFQDKILFLESMGGDVAKITTYLTQYKHMGVLKKINGIILGSYTEMEKQNYFPDIVELVKRAVDNKHIPIIKTNEIGHGKDSKCIIIGQNMRIVSD